MSKQQVIKMNTLCINSLFTSVSLIIIIFRMARPEWWIFWQKHWPTNNTSLRTSHMTLIILGTSTCVTFTASACLLSLKQPPRWCNNYTIFSLEPFLTPWLYLWLNVPKITSTGIPSPRYGDKHDTAMTCHFRGPWAKIWQSSPTFRILFTGVLALLVC